MDRRDLPDQPFSDDRARTFSKALDLSDLWPLFMPLLIAVPVVMGLSILLLKNRRGNARIT